jgi:hypothetical protein
MSVNSVRVVFSHYTPKVLTSDEYDIVYNDSLPWGIRINGFALEVREVTDTVGGSKIPHVSVVTGAVGTATDTYALATDAETLSYDYLVKGSLRVSSGLLGLETEIEEIDFLDGHSEFIGLIPMEEEETIAISSGSDAYVTFNLAAGALWYDGFPVVFGDVTVFQYLVGSASAAQTGSVGDYYVDTNGLVTLNVGVGASLTAGIGLQYYYKDPNFDPTNKYSVDYERGAIYSYTPLVDGQSITYKVLNGKIAYDLAKQVDSYTYNPSARTVSVRTEGLEEINSLVKILWEKTDSSSALSSYREYFTPIIHQIAFKCA